MRSRTLVATGVALAVVAIAGIAGAGVGIQITGGGEGDAPAALSCPGGMARLGHVLNERSSIFPGDPKTKITLAATVAKDGFQVEKLTVGVHTGTHIDVPGHFIADGRYVDELLAEEFVWPAYVIDVVDRIGDPTPDDFQLSIADVVTYESIHGEIPHGAMVIIRTGFDSKFATPAYFDPAPGFAGDTVRWMVANRRIAGIGSDTLGPDATSDELFDATFSILDLDRVALPDIANAGEIAVTGDIIMAPAVALENGSGFMVDPLLCKGS